MDSVDSYTEVGDIKMTLSEGIDKAGNVLSFIWDVLKMTWRIISNKYVLVGAFTAGVVCMVNVFFTLYELRTPVIVTVQAPYIARHAEYASPVITAGVEDSNVMGVSVEPATAEGSEVAPVATKAEVIENMIHFIEGKESSFGENDNPRALHNICKAKGMSNNLGFGGMAKMLCYDSESEAETVVRGWLIQRWNEMNGDTKMILCYYNQGVKVRNCSYAQDF
jgi:hypothetical protein